jgi:hypothetical protein
MGNSVYEVSNTLQELWPLTATRISRNSFGNLPCQARGGRVLFGVSFRAAELAMLNSQ